MKNVFDCIPDTPPRVEPEEMTAKEFALKMLSSPEFYTYIKTGIQYGTLPSAIVCRLMDYGWGKPPERVEHTGKDGNPIITEVRRVVVSARAEEDQNPAKPSTSVH